MSKLRVVYIVSLVTLAGLIAFAVFRPMVSGGNYSEVQQEQLLQTRDEWIIQFNIINHEGRDQTYTITVVVDGKQHSEKVTIPDGRIFAYIYHIRRDMITEGKASFAICKEGVETPIEEATYYLK